ncbi:MAG: histidine phosphatase family protein [Candidatus Promineifilaceae bacterium]
MQLYLIRHAESENNALYARTGSYEQRNPDPRLSETGHAQAQLLARFLDQANPEAKTDAHDTFDQRGFKITHIYCSLLRRSIETALAISEVLDIPAVAYPDLHEWGGMFELVGEEERKGLAGPNRAFFSENYPDLVLPDSLDDEGWWSRPHEEKHETFPRAERVLRELLSLHKDFEDHVVLVTHAGFFHSLLTTLFEIPLDANNEYWGTKVLFAANNAAITRISINQRGVVMMYLNRVDFLPRGLIT